MDFIQTILTFLKSIIESAEFRTFVISLITLAIAWVYSRRTRLSIKTEAEKRAAEQSAALDAKYKEQTKQLELSQQEERNKSEAAFRQAFAEIKRDFDEERRKNERLEKRLNELQDARTQDSGKIANLEQQLSELKATNIKLNETLLTRTEERDAALALVTKQNGELKHREQQIADLTAKMEGLQKRLEALEHKPDTSALNAATMPDTPPADAPESPLPEGDTIEPDTGEN